MGEIELNINRGIIDLNLCVDSIEKNDKSGAIAYFRIVKTIIEEYPDKTTHLQEKYQKIRILYETKFGILEKGLQ